MIENLLENVRLGEVRLISCESVNAALVRLRAWGEQQLAGPRTVLCHWTEVPQTASILSQSIDALARTALALWPAWYGERGNGRTDAPRDAFDALPGGASVPWVKAATARCRAGLLPRPSKFANAIHAAQLALAIEPGRLHLVLAQSGRQGETGKLLGLARAAEWLAKETQARLAVLVPKEIARSPTFDSINFKAVNFPPAPSLTAPVREEKQSLLVVPFHGRPHPDSPGEQLLAECLERDPELAGRFCFNQPVKTVRGNLLTVDLLCEKLRLVVEVDGFGWHSGPMAFRQDRHRDYELSLSGYLVLRLTHEEVVEDVVLAMEKIRDLAAYRSREMNGKGGDS